MNWSVIEKKGGGGGDGQEFSFDLYTYTHLDIFRGEIKRSIEQQIVYTCPWWGFYVYSF